MSKKDNNNSLWNRIMNESNFDEEFESMEQSSDFNDIPQRKHKARRNDRILSSDECFVGEDAIEYRPKKHSRRDDDRYKSIRNSYDKRERGKRENDFEKKRSYKKDGKRSFDNLNERNFDASNKKSFKRSEKRDFDKSSKKDYRSNNFSSNYDDKSFDRRSKGRDFKKQNNNQKQPLDELVRLNKFIADAGVCSRRDADKLIEAGCVTVNGQIVNVLGTKVRRTDKVQVEGQTLSNEKLRYLLLNKPKGYITTLEDECKRNTVMKLVEDACKERIYPVGRLDRNTSGLLLFTNDGDLANKLMHPSSEIIKIYHVVLDKNVTWNDIKSIREGFVLDDGFIKVDAIEYVTGKGKNEVGVQIHSGRNRIVRRIFEHLGYDIIKLDRTLYAGLTKKDLPRGKWRFLTEDEVNYLKKL